MKPFVALLVLNILGVISPMRTSAQKNNLFADIGLPFHKIIPGASLTYNYKLTKHIAAGPGIQGVNCYPTITNNFQLVPAIFEDLRFSFRVREKSCILTFLDCGIDFYKKTNEYYK